MDLNDAFPSKYLKAADLKGQKRQVKIAQVVMENIGNDNKPVVSFVGASKQMVLNKTNAMAIADICGSANTDDWAGKEIVVYPTKTNYQSKFVDCIRVEPPRKAPPLVQSPPPPKPPVQQHVTGVDDPALDVSDPPF